MPTLTQTPQTPVETAWNRQSILKHMQDNDVRFLRLQFTDITGTNKNVEVPASQFEKALDGEVMFDGSSIEGFTRIEESDMLLKPSLDSYRVDPWGSRGGVHTASHGQIASVICDVFTSDERAFSGCPRGTLKKVTAQAAELGYAMNCGPEAEFFLFQRGANGEATTETHDSAGYFDLAPIDLGEECRREIVIALEKLGFEIEAAHHEVAPGQHEIDFKYDDALITADRLTMFRFVVRRVARDMGLHATFMPKPIFGQNGSGMHVHQSLFRGKENAFYDKNAANGGISDEMRWYIGGLLHHARAMVAITNPTVNSYKRLVPGYEAPTHLAWSMRNRSPLIRIPDRRGIGTRAELRMPDPSCNPYLAFAVMLAAGLNGIKNKIEPPAPVSGNVYRMSARERSRLKIKSLPGNLGEALDAFEKDKVLKDALGEHTFHQFIIAKRSEWSDYIAAVHPWELDRYLTSM
ncbi:MAG: type I glutamate--ammonia ligase [Planctomycetes bacterium]|nr:type I glutamate--ammonia ligase [Planctomycetota bacterium]